MNSKSLVAFNQKIRVPLVWILRLAIGAVFVFSGFAKAVDPWGFIYKINDYLAVWEIDWMWHDAVLTIAVTLSALEFTCGVLLLTGSLRRTICCVMLAIMAFMLPLTVYIAIANPVPDCGCFGDAYVISNTATLLKNIAITLGLVYLLYNNSLVAGLFYPLVQWVVIVASALYCMLLSFYGYNFQPLVDFRSFPEGTSLVADTPPEVKMVYERDGERQTFALDALPDSTWTYVDRYVVANGPLHSAFAIYDGDEDVTASVIEDEGSQLMLLVADPEWHPKSRGAMANNLNTYIEKYGGNMIAVVGTSPDNLDKWIDQAKPTFDVYTADDTSVKEMVRGRVGLVYLNDGKIVWKQNLYALSGDFPDFQKKENQLEKIKSDSDRHTLRTVTLLYLCVPAALLLMSVFRLRRSGKGKKQVAKKEDKAAESSEQEHQDDDQPTIDK